MVADPLEKAKPRHARRFLTHVKSNHFTVRSGRSTARWLSYAPDEVGIDQCADAFTPIAESDRDRLAGRESEFVWHPTLDLHMPCCDECVLAKPGEDLNVENLLVHSVADCRRLHEMAHYRHPAAPLSTPE